MKDVIFTAVKVRGKRNVYTSEWVNKLFSMIEGHCTYKNIGFCCLTDDPKGIRKDVQTVKIKHNPKLKGWWAKVNLFDPDLPFEKGQRLIFSDLDNLIIGDMDEVINLSYKFSTAPSTAPNFKPEGVITCYSSAFMVWNHGEKSEIFTEYSDKVPKMLRGDQDWMAHILGTDEPKMPIQWFQRLGGCKEKGPREGVKVIFCVKPKNHIAAKEIEWVRKIWK